MDTKPLNPATPQQQPSADKKDNSTAKTAGTAAAVAILSAGGTLAATTLANDHDAPAVEPEETTSATDAVEVPTAEPQPQEPPTAPLSAAPQTAPQAATTTSTTPTASATPAQPTAPEAPHTSETPENPVAPENPTSPTTPEEPTTPETPDTPRPIDPSEDIPVISQVEIDPDDIDLPEPYKFDEVGRIYTVDGREMLAAHAYDPDGNEIVMVDIDGDDIIDGQMIGDNIIPVGDVPLTISDAEHNIADPTAYVPPTPDIDPELPEGEDFMNDIVDA